MTRSAALKIDDVEERELIPGTRVRFVHSDRMTVAYWHFDPGIDLPEHSHPHDQITNVIEGEFELTVEGVPEILSAGHYRVDPAGRSALRPFDHGVQDHRCLLARSGGLPLKRCEKEKRRKGAEVKVPGPLSPFPFSPFPLCLPDWHPESRVRARLHCHPWPTINTSLSTVAVAIVEEFASRWKRPPKSRPSSATAPSAQ